jgi:polysaccharide chain length determinant protein (PEP-CTERM system associated)
MLGHRTLNVEDYMAIIRRRWLLILIPAVLFPLIGYMITYTLDPQYVSQTLVLIEQQQVPTDYVRPVISEDLDSRLASMREQITSRSSIQPIIEKYNLYGTKHMTMDDRIDTMRKAISIKVIHSDIANSNGLPGFFISFQASDPQTAQSICGEITSLFVKQNLLSRAEAVDQTTQFLQSQLDQAKRTLDDEDAKLAAFQRQYFGQLPTDQTSNQNVLSSLNTQLSAQNDAIQNLEQNKAIVTAMISQQSQATPTSLVASRTSEAQEKQLQDLIAQETDLTTHYTAENPDVKAVHRKIAELQKEMATEAAAEAKTPASPAPATTARAADSVSLQQMRAQLTAYNMQLESHRREQQALESKIQGYTAKIESTPQVEEQFKELTRDYGQANDLYQSLLAKMHQSEMATDLEKRQQGEQFKILDQPNLPDSPTFPRRGVFAAGGLAFGLGLGLLTIALLEYKDTAMRNERDVWAFTQLPTLAVIAWSGDVAHIKPSRRERLKRLFRFRRQKDVLADVNA